MIRFVIARLLVLLAASAVVVAATVSSAAAAALPVTARAALDRQTITIGDPVLLTVRVEAERGWTVVDPGVTRTLGAFEVLETLPAQQTDGPAGLVRLSFRYRVTAFRVGEGVVPPIGVLYQGPDGARGVAPTAEIAVAVLSVLKEGETFGDLKPLRPQIVLGGGLAYQIARGLTAVGAGVVAVGALVVLLRRVRRRSRIGLAPLAVSPAFAADRSVQTLTVLAKAGLAESGRFEEHYERLGGAIRDYLHARHGLAAHERTAAELRRDMEGVGMERMQAAFLFDLLRESEIVRFRHTPPSPRRANEVVGSALDFLKRAAVSDEYELAAGRRR
ncbi:MAG: hypothetical protein EXR61_04025 [Chloroflexi bacterium]|nr:hypothetical protein [Chloroflexota bacterium]